MLVSQQTEQLQKKLNQAIETRKKMELSHISQLELFCQFVTKLSNVCKGVDIELDNRLAKFRNAISKGIDFAALSPIIDDTLLVLKHHSARNDANFRELQTSVTQAGKKLQQRKGLPPELRRDLRSLLSEGLEGISATNDFLPILTRLIKLYETVLDKKVSGSENESATNAPSDIADFSRELVNLISELAFEGESGKRIDDIKTNLIAHATLDSLLDSCIEIIRIIVITFTKERLSAQQFLLAIDETLEQLHKNLSSSIAQSVQTSSRLAELNQKINSKIFEIEQGVEEANSLEQLKHSISDKMAALTLSIQEKEKLEKDERDNLTATLNSMSRRVKALEKETHNYQQRLAEQKFKSLQDALTSLPNRAAFDERYLLEYNSFKRHGQSLCMVVLDVDHFKRINDNYGHSAGDKTLQVIAQALRKSIRVTDFIARFGGEEFVLIMPNSQLQSVIAPLEKLRKTIKAIPFKFKGETITITISIGATQLKAGDTMQQAFDRADDALYEAKNAGRDQLVLKK